MNVSVSVSSNPKISPNCVLYSGYSDTDKYCMVVPSTHPSGIVAVLPVTERYGSTVPTGASLVFDACTAPTFSPDSKSLAPITVALNDPTVVCCRTFFDI